MNRESRFKVDDRKTDHEEVLTKTGSTKKKKTVNGRKERVEYLGYVKRMKGQGKIRIHKR